ncbi:MAG: sigma-70 family RNA polymerase sigma factor [Prevotella sp.]|nr:sigma-70 family RNA polymerase sigma factor [Prevotella sp.]
MNEHKIIDQLVKENQGFVIAMAKRYTGRGVELDDLVSEGNLAMVLAAEKFDAAKGKKFIAYAAPFIKRAITKAIETEAPQNPLSVDEPLPVGSRNTMNLLHVLENKNAPRADEQLNALSDREDAEKLIATLPQREQEVLRLYFGIGGQKMTMAEIGEYMGLKRERVRQIRDKALRALSKASAILPLI